MKQTINLILQNRARCLIINSNIYIFDMYTACFFIDNKSSDFIGIASQKLSIMDDDSIR